MKLPSFKINKNKLGIFHTLTNDNEVPMEYYTTMSDICRKLLKCARCIRTFSRKKELVSFASMLRSYFDMAENEFHEIHHNHLVENAEDYFKYKERIVSLNQFVEMLMAFVTLKKEMMRTEITESMKEHISEYAKETSKLLYDKKLKDQYATEEEFYEALIRQEINQNEELSDLEYVAFEVDMDGVSNVVDQAIEEVISKMSEEEVLMEEIKYSNYCSQREVTIDMILMENQRIINIYHLWQQTGEISNDRKGKRPKTL